MWSIRSKICTLPQFFFLFIAEHGTPDQGRPLDSSQGTLRSRIIRTVFSDHDVSLLTGRTELNLFRSSNITMNNDYDGINSILQNSNQITVQALPTMTLKSLRQKVCKLAPGKATSAVLWIQMADGSLAELKPTSDKEELAWLGLEQGTNVVFALSE
jgi:hypothetical protein